jgi:lysozyme family protein
VDKNFQKCLVWLLEHEGGLTNLKNDRGGLTNLGVTHEEYDRYRRFKGLSLRSVSMITREEAQDVYRTFYWNVSKCDLLPDGVENAIFDMAVNNGVVGAAKAAQRVTNKLVGAGLAVDGHIGPITCDAIDDCPEVAFINAFCDERLRVDSGFFNWKSFGKAWTNRVNGNAKLKIVGVRTQSLSLVTPDVRPVKVPMPAPVVADATIYNRATSAIANLFRRS